MKFTDPKAPGLLHEAKVAYHGYRPLHERYPHQQQSKIHHLHQIKDAHDHEKVNHKQGKVPTYIIFNLQIINFKNKDNLLKKENPVQP